MKVDVDLVQGIFLCKRSWLFWLLYPRRRDTAHILPLVLTAAYIKYDYVLQTPRALLASLP